MYGIKLFFFAALIATLSLASAAYTPEQNALKNAMQIGWEMRGAYDIAREGQDITGFNALVDKYNAWVRANFGEDANMLMQKMAGGPVDLSKPYLVGNNTTNNGIVHAIDASGKYGPTFTTNDVNLMPDWAIAKYANSEQGRTYGEGYLGGI